LFRNGGWSRSIIVDNVHAENVPQESEPTVGPVPKIADLQAENVYLQDANQSVEAADGVMPIAARNLTHLGGPTVEDTTVDSVTTDNMQEAENHCDGDTDQADNAMKSKAVSSKRKARQNAMRRKQRKSIPHKLEETGGVVTLTEEEAKDRGARTNQKFVYDLNTLCQNSESEIAKPGVTTAHDSPTQEGANVDTPTGDGAVLTAAATHADGIQITAASNADTIARGAVRGDEQHAEFTLSATVPTGMGASSKKAKVARGVNTLTDGGDVSLITPPAEACSEKRKVARIKAVKTDKSVDTPADTQAEVIFEMTFPGNCINTGANKVSTDLEEDSRDDFPAALTYNVFEGGSKRSRHRAPKGSQYVKKLGRT
jgi:hypothetical protein